MTGTKDTPLHVQVAEALGCRPRLCVGCDADGTNRRTWWDCECGDWAHCGGPDTPTQDVSRYDTDWSATGPLIEKYGIGIELWEDNQWRVWYESDDLSMDIHGDVGNSVLVAVCRLILALGKAGKLCP
jgi:hypothetical protein